jgi:hypothetical protein
MLEIKKHTASFILPIDLIQFLDLQGKLNDINRSQVLRKIIREYKERLESSE